MKLGSAHTPVADAWTKKFPMGPEQRDSVCVSLGQTCIALYDIAHHCIALYLIITIDMYVVGNLDFVKPCVDELLVLRCKLNYSLGAL
uniref:Putative ovule protein n=1 Tax=Solanum chacoense TaxID=4108 RepID=A0A0V0GNA0_SOLCH